MKLLIIDGHAILHRAFHALPPLTAPDGRMVNAVYGFTTLLLKALRELQPTHIAVTFDTEAATFRHEAYAAYKAQREEQPDELYAQIEPIEEICAAFGIPVYAVDGYEADDVIGTLVEESRASSGGDWTPDITILTGDLDTLQLVRPGVVVVSPKQGISNAVSYDTAAVRERYGLEPEQLIDYKALAGDPSDNIPGVPGIGKKTATAILQAFGTLDAALEAARAGRGETRTVSAKVLQKLLDHGDAIALGKRLVTIVRNVPLAFDLKDAELTSIDRDRIVERFRAFGFHSLLARLPSESEHPSTNAPAQDGADTRARSSVNADHGERPYALVGHAAVAEALQRRPGDGFAFLAECDPGSPRTAHPRTLAFAWDGETSALAPWGKALAATAPLFPDPGLPKDTHDAKAAMHLLGRSHVALDGLRYDTMLLSYLLAPGTRKHDLEQVAFAELGVELKGEPVASADSKEGERSEAPPAHARAAARVRAIAALAPHLAQRLRDEDLVAVYETIERPLAPVLYRMERNGIRIDVPALQALAATMREQLARADAAIFQLAGRAFNIDSPKQLKEVLFVELGIAARGIRKTAKGGKLSTAASELEKLRDAHPIVAHLFTHRELAKLLSTYVDALPALVDPMTGRVHTTYHQTVAATGRLSSSDPNLQNIPVSEPWGPAIRRAFIPEDGWALLAADYSQFELRVAAHLSGDAALQEAFRSGADIHAATGARVFGVAPEAVTKDQRRIAKAINFGIIYGMGATALAANVGCTRDEAHTWIDDYLAAYPDLALWIEETKRSAAKRGFVQTLFGRKRYLPEIASGVPMVRAAAERMAVNMPIQGTQADLVKLAMIAVDRWIEDGRVDRVRLLLQVHDELVFEIREDALADVTPVIRGLLEGIHELSVPIVVDAKAGRSWGELTAMP